MATKLHCPGLAQGCFLLLIVGYWGSIPPGLAACWRHQCLGWDREMQLRPGARYCIFERQAKSGGSRKGEAGISQINREIKLKRVIL